MSRRTALRLGLGAALLAAAACHVTYIEIGSNLDDGTGAGPGMSTSTTSAMGTGGTGNTSTSACDFTAPSPCAGADQLPSIDGDESQDMRTATGRTSAWFDIFVADTATFGFDWQLSYTATLESPPGTSYGLFIYTGDGSGPNCSATPIEGTGDPPSVSDAWADSFSADDSRWLSVEVRYLSGNACGPSDLWTLTMAGNPQP